MKKSTNIRGKTPTTSVKTNALNKINSIKSTVKNISFITIIMKYIKKILAYIFKFLYLDKVEKKTLFLIISTIKLILRIFVYTNLVIAVFIYLSKLLNLDHNFTWDTYVYLFLFIYYTLRDFVFDISNRIYSIVRSTLEKLINNIQEIKENVESKNNIAPESSNKVTQPAKESYKYLKDNGKLDDVQPKQDGTRKLMYTILALVAFTGIFYILYNNPDIVKEFIIGTEMFIWTMKRKIVNIKRSISRFIRRLFGDDKGKGPAGPRDLEQQNLGYYEYRFGQDNKPQLDEFGEPIISNFRRFQDGVYIIPSDPNKPGPSRYRIAKNPYGVAGPVTPPQGATQTPTPVHSPESIRGKNK